MAPVSAKSASQFIVQRVAHRRCDKRLCSGKNGSASLPNAKAPNVRSCNMNQRKLCWACLKNLDGTAFFCSEKSCGKLQPLPSEINYFQVLGVPITFNVNTSLLKRQYLNYQASIHPDNFSRKPATEQKLSDSNSTMVNRAYNVLKTPLSRAEYMLELFGCGIQEGDSIKSDSELLMQVLEERERFEECIGDSVQVSVFAEQLQARVDAIIGKLSVLLDGPAPSRESLQLARTLAVSLKYWDRLLMEVRAKQYE